MPYYRISPTPPETVIKRQGKFAYWASPYYDEDFKVALDASIPWVDRKWYSTLKVWAVRPQHVDTLADLVEKFYLSRPAIQEV